MNRMCFRIIKMLCIAETFIAVMTNCESTYQAKIPANEIPKSIIQLDSTRLLVSEVLRDLDEPWEVTWGRDEHLWFTEKKGNVMRMNPMTKKVKMILNIPEVHTGRTTGLLGMVLHPDFKQDPWVYVHYTYTDSTVSDQFSRSGHPNYIRSKVVRYKYFFQEDTLKDPEIILPDIPGNSSHNGSRLTISEDNKLLFVIGEVAISKNAQTQSVLPGKVLRLNLDGSVPSDNPILGSYFYTMGHRNPQGLVAANGKIYSSEHGPNNDDEINLIKPGENYGWPFVEGYCDKENEMTFCDSVKVTEPIYTWTPTIAPAGLDFYSSSAIPEWTNNLMLATLKGQALWLFELDESGEKIVKERIYLQEQFGRLRDLCVSSSGDVYVVTSNTDWNVARYGSMYNNIPKDGNDRILKISVIQDESSEILDGLKVFTKARKPIKMEVQDRMSIPGAVEYRDNCSSCHGRRGRGIPDFTPPLIGTSTVADKQKLIETTLFGMSGEIEVLGEKYNEIMPGFATGLTNQELAELLNYIRIVGNNLTDSVSVGEIDEIRKSRTF